MRVNDYFERIGWSGPASPTRETLGPLVRAHNHTIPFENLDVQLRNTLTTEVEEAYDKIVNRGRGGWCYEQNGLFGWALAEIGFDVQRVAASVMRSESGPRSHANHLTLLVSVPDDDTRWLVDVGFGGSLLHPIPFAEGAHEHSPFTVGLRQLDDGSWQFWEDFGEGEFSFDFEDVPADEEAMRVRCDFLQTSPEAGLFLNLVCQLRRPSAHVVLRGRVFSVRTSEGKSERLLESADDLVTTLRDEFELNVPGAVDLWDRVCERHEEIVAEKKRSE